MYALIIVDMLNDFVSEGALANERNALHIIPSLQTMLHHAREHENWVVVYANDEHNAQDREMSIWGEHAMKGTRGAQVVDALKPHVRTREWEEPKQFYGAFDNTTLAQKLGEHGTQRVFICGQHADCCVRHTSYGAFMHNFDITILSDCVCLFEDKENTEAEETKRFNDALGYLQLFYGAEVLSSEQVIHKYR